MHSKGLHPYPLRVNFAWTFAGNVVYAACQWGILMVLSKLGTPEMVGQLALGLAVTAPVIMFTNLSLRQVQATDARDLYAFGDYLGLRITSTVIALVVIAVVNLVVGYRWETALVILVVGLAKGFEAISDVFYGLLQQHERMDRIARSMMIKGSLSLLVFGIAVYLTANLLWGVTGFAAVWALILISYDHRSGILILSAKSQVPHQAQSARGNPLAAVQPRWQMQTLRELVGLALPLGLATMLLSLNTNTPRYFVERYLGERELGFFAAMAYLLVAGNTVVTALGQSASPRLAKHYASGNSRAFHVLLVRLVGIGTLLGAGGLLVALFAGREVLTLLYRQEYATRTDVFVWLMAAAAVNYIAVFLGYGMTAVRYFKIQPIIFAMSTVLTALCCLFLVPRYGILGAAWATLLSACFRAIAGLASNVHATHALGKRAHSPLGE